ncbi:MAG: DUF2158 domain-containing protein [Cyanobacteriota bacterium]|jgi:uncharacterized protein YodC (DUF2158 family)|nr:DUF2158 domain-containing protein [Cyanobacteriota bacterium]
MASPAFKIGDVVQLKSGGPMMTITSMEEGNDIVHALWFDGTKKETGSFPIGAIQYGPEQRPSARQGRAFFQKPPQ